MYCFLRIEDKPVGRHTFAGQNAQLTTFLSWQTEALQESQDHNHIGQTLSQDVIEYLRWKSLQCHSTM